MMERKVKRLCVSNILPAILSFTLMGCDMPDNITDIVHGRNDTEDISTESTEETAPPPIASLIDYDEPIDIETGTTAINPNSKDFLEKLESGSFYVIHDGLYYPAFAFASNYDFTDTLKDYIDPYANKQMYFTAKNELEIPTLFLADGDKLVYYDTENVLDYVKWERYKDIGYTIGVYNIYQTDYSKLAYIDLEEDEGCIISGSSLEAINTDMTSNLVSLVRIGNVDITEDLIVDGLISGAKAGDSYDLEVYDGTNYHHYIATADMHAFKAYEMFASIEVTPLQQYVWEIEIPDYFVNGYYKVNANCTTVDMNDGLVRIVKENSFTNSADLFNEQLLFPYTEQQIAEGDYEEGDFLYQYSECDALNKFNTPVVGTLGYDDGVEEKTLEEKTSILRTANINTFDIYFPEGETCNITIYPSKKEVGGDAYVLIGNRINSLTYNAFENSYSTTIKGDGNIYTLYVSGFWNSYDIRLSNCKQDTSGNSKSIKTEELTDDTYSLDGYTKANEEKGQQVLDALNQLNSSDNGTSSEESTEDVAQSEEINSEDEDE